MCYQSLQGRRFNFINATATQINSSGPLVQIREKVQLKWPAVTEHKYQIL
jgi:hypothetical protein